MQRGRAQVPTSIKHRAHHASVRRGESPVPSPDDKGECSFKAGLEQSDGQARRGARDRDLLAAARSLLLGDLGDELELLLGLARDGGDRLGRVHVADHLLVVGHDRLGDRDRVVVLRVLGYVPGGEMALEYGGLRCAAAAFYPRLINCSPPSEGSSLRKQSLGWIYPRGNASHAWCGLIGSWHARLGGTGRAEATACHDARRCHFILNCFRTFVFR